MKKIIKIITILITILFLVSIGAVLTIKTMARKQFAGKVVSAQIASPIDFSDDLSQLSAENSSMLQEVGVFGHSIGSVPIAITGVENSDNLLVIYKDGRFDRWSISSGSILATRSVFVVTAEGNTTGLNPVSQISRNISFSNDGSLVITPNEVSQNGMIGFNIWNTNTLTQLICFGKETYCSDVESDSVYTGLLLHPTKDLYFNAFSGSVSGWTGFTSLDGSGKYFNIRSGDFESTTITRLAMDPLGDYLAISDNSGNVRISDISIYENDAPDTQVLGFPGDANYRLSNPDEKNINTIDLKFDETHSWLGWLNDENLTIWSLKNYVFPLHFTTKLQDGNSICFDRSGRILAVATKVGIRIFDIENKSVIKEYPVGEVTSLYFSRDNRILIWGDAEGNIHLWGVPQE